MLYILSHSDCGKMKTATPAPPKIHSPNPWNLEPVDECLHGKGDIKLKC